MNKNKQGFVKIEFVMIFCIIIVLFTVAFVGVNAARGKAKVSTAREDLVQMYAAVQLLAADTDQWPGHLQASFDCKKGDCSKRIRLCKKTETETKCIHGLGDPVSGLLVNDTPASGGPYQRWNGPYITHIPLDPWGNEYFFDTQYNHIENGPSIVLGSFGQNGIQDDGDNLENDDLILFITK